MHKAGHTPAGGIRFLVQYGRRHIRLTGTVLLLVMLGAVAAVSAQYGLKQLVDAMTTTAAAHGGGGQDANAVTRYLALFLGLLALEGVCWRLGGFVGAKAVVAVGEDIRVDLFAMVSGRDWEFFNGQTSGALAGRITTAATSATASLRTLVWNILPPATDLVGSVIVLCLVDWRIGGALLVVAAPITALLHRAGGRGFPLHAAYHREAASVGGVLTDVLANIGLVHAFGTPRWEQDRLRSLIATENRAHSGSWFFLERLRCWHDLVFWLVNASVLAISIHEWREGVITTGGVVIATTLTLRILASSREMALSLLGLSQQLGAVTEALHVLAPGQPASMQRPFLHPDRGALVVRGVHYAPTSRRPLFEELNLVVPAGQRLGIVGPSGTGKSTLLRIVQGIVPPSEGHVLLDGQVLADHAPESLSAGFSVVTQDAPLLQRSVLENLCYGSDTAEWPDVLAASRALGCDDFINEMPNGYETIVGERGARLSGGQRIAIARAMLRRAPVLLLDEATSALDTNAERDVQRAILALAGHRTIVAVAHRLSTLMDFDRIVVIEDGRIIEDGSPSELCEAGGYFAQTWRMQRSTLPVLGTMARHASWARGQG